MFKSEPMRNRRCAFSSIDKSNENKYNKGDVCAKWRISMDDGTGFLSEHTL